MVNSLALQLQGPIYIALFDYEQRTSEDLTFRKGEKLEIINAQVSLIPGEEGESGGCGLHRTSH